MASPFLFLCSLSAETVPIWQTKTANAYSFSSAYSRYQSSILSFTNHRDTEECFALKFEIRNPKHETNREIEELGNYGIQKR